MKGPEPNLRYGRAFPKGTKLTREAAHYKVNCDRVLREVKEKLTPMPAKPKPNSKSQTSAKPDGKGKPK